MLGLGLDRLRAEMNHLLTLLFHQGVLDEHFLQLRQLENEGCPNFVSEVINIYFQESEKRLRQLTELLMEKEVDYKKMGMHLNKLLGSSSSIGAKRVTSVCIAFRALLVSPNSHHNNNNNNRSKCLRALKVLEEEYCYLTNKLHELLHLEQQQHVLALGIRYPRIQN